MGKSFIKAIENGNLDESGMYYTLSLIGGRYKMAVLYTIFIHGVVRFNELKREIGMISHKTLSATLRELEKDKLIVRKEYPQIPPKVEYRLSDKGETLIPIIDMLCTWGEENRPK